MIESAQYSNEEQTSVSVVLDGKTLSVPTVEGNRHYQMLKEWEAEGNTIQPYVAPTVRVTSIEPEEFFDRFTEAEQDAIIAESYNDVKTKKFYDRMMMQKSVELESQKLLNGMDYLVSKNLITEARKTEILSVEEKQGD